MMHCFGETACAQLCAQRLLQGRQQRLPVPSAGGHSTHLPDLSRRKQERRHWAARLRRTRCSTQSSCSSVRTLTAPGLPPGLTAPGRQLLLSKCRSAALLAAACGLWALCRQPQGGSSAFLSVAAVSATRLSFVGVAQSAWAGMGAGFLHTLSGPDHLAALIPLTVGRPMFRASLLGALWGFGHSLGQLVLGVLLVLLKDRFEQLLPTLSKYASVTVGLTLLLIGALGLVEARAELEEEEAEALLVSELRLAPAGAGESPAVAFRTASVSPIEQPVDQPSGGQTSGSAAKEDVTMLRTLATGVVFGLQPDALYVILPALVLPTRTAAAAYILLFVVGTVTAMGSYTAFIGATSHAIAERNANIVTSLSTIASSVALAAGVVILALACGLRVPFV